MACFEEEFRSLCQKSYDIDGTTLNAPDTEPYLRAVLDLVRAHPEKRAVSIDLFLRVVHKELLAAEYLVEYCMHVLKFPELKAQLLRELEENKANPACYGRIRFISAVLSAYEDDWRDAQLWSFESKNPSL